MTRGSCSRHLPAHLLSRGALCSLQDHSVSLSSSGMWTWAHTVGFGIELKGRLDLSSLDYSAFPEPSKYLKMGFGLISWLSFLSTHHFTKGLTWWGPGFLTVMASSLLCSWIICYGLCESLWKLQGVPCAESWVTVLFCAPEGEPSLLNKHLEQLICTATLTTSGPSRWEGSGEGTCRAMVEHAL